MKNIIKKTIIGAGIVLSSILPAKAQNSFFVEESMDSSNGQQTFYHLGWFDRDQKPTLRYFVIDEKDNTTTEFAARNYFEKGKVKSSAEIIGFDSDDSNGIGVNARADIGKTRIGGALEKIADEKLKYGYVERKLGNASVGVGASNVEDTKAKANFSYTKGQHLVGAGVTEDSHVTAVFGKFAQEKGKGLGYRAVVKVNEDGNYEVRLLSSTNTTLSRGSMAAMVALDNGFHDAKLMENWVDAHVSLLMRTTPGGVALDARYSDKQGVKKGSADAVYQLPGENVSPRVRVGYSRNAGVESGKAGLGVDIKGNYLDAIVTTTEGEKPVVTLIGGYCF